MAFERVDGYAPIGGYALLGDGHGTALVCADGSVDWLAVPRADSAPLLAAVLDADVGGHLALRPSVPHRVERRYLEGTMVLETSFITDAATLRVTDAMDEGTEGRLPWSELARVVEADGAPVPVSWELRPGTRLSTVRPWVHRQGDRVMVQAGDLLVTLVLDALGEPVLGDGVVSGQAVVEPGRPALLALVVAESHPVRLPSPEQVRRRHRHTVEEWRRWSDLVQHDGQHRDQVVRSALVIKALSSIDSGALAAAPTTSLPEVVGDGRTFDYRFAWVRDASYMIDACTRLGLHETVDRSLDWLLRAVQRTAPDIHVFYTLDGEPAAGEEQTDPLFAGYRSTGPVTIGNKAAAQTQHGSYGDLLGAVSRHVDGGARLDTGTGLAVARLVDRLCDEWPRPDAGLWELSQSRRYTSSLVNAWTALDRAIHLVEQGQVPDIHVERWRQARADVHTYADRHCWSDTKQSYTFYEGTDDLDAAVLLAARTGFLAGDDPRLSSTIDAIRAELTAEGPLLYRYSGAAKEEHCFVACSFWLVEALCVAGRVAEATGLLDQLLPRANDLGLWAEEIDAATGELFGNFPIGISHLAVIGALTAHAEATASSR